MAQSVSMSSSSPSSLSSNFASISQTASDALHSKYAAFLHAGYTPFPPTESFLQDIALYRTLLDRVMNAVVFINKRSSTTAPRRQTPLVHLGYAMRVAVLLSTIQTFVTNTNQQTKRQLLIFGAGLDVAGLWVGLRQVFYGHDHTRSPDDEACLDGVHVVEVDRHDVFQRKKQVIQQLFSSGWEASDSCREEWKRIRTTATVEFEVDSDLVLSLRLIGQAGNQFQYTLWNLDLRDTHQLDQILLSRNDSNTKLDPLFPTLIVSELVLTYLDDEHPVRQDSACDRLLEWCAHKVCNQNSYSCMIALEALGPAPEVSHAHNGGLPSALEGYKQAYSQKFTSKLQRGSTKHHGDTSKEGKNTSFCPIASSCQSADTRLKQRGFASRQVHSTLLGTAITGLDNRARMEFDDVWWKPCELFDEHAALVLHLKTYVVVCAFSSLADAHAATLYKQRLCPWIVNGAFTFPKPTILSTKERIWISGITRNDEEKVRSMFSDAYKHLFDDYPAIRKMVKTALKKDLTMANDRKVSLIHSHYAASGGVFLIAIDQEGDLQRRNIVGAIGLRKLSAQELSSRNDLCIVDDTIDTASLRNVYEVHRLVVDPVARGGGIGTALLQRAKEAIHVRLQRDYKSNIADPTDKRRFHLVATTPSLLDAANSFYKANGFRLLKQHDIGNLTMTTYLNSEAGIK